MTPLGQRMLDELQRRNYTPGKIRGYSRQQGLRRVIWRDIDIDDLPLVRLPKKFDP